MRRREFLSLLGSMAVAWPLAASAQQSAMPVIGLLAPWGRGDSPQLLAAFREGLMATGFVEGQNIAIEYRSAGNQNEQLPALAADLVHRQVTVIVAASTPAALAAKAATTTIPVVFETGNDPVQLGLVATLNRPGGNVTGVTNFNVVVAPKRLELLHELLPTTTVMALLANPTNPSAEIQANDVLSAAHNLGLELHVLKPTRTVWLGGYAARILKGEKPAELPVQQSTKVELFLNLKAAKALGITFPFTLLGRADEVIE